MENVTPAVIQKDITWVRTHVLLLFLGLALVAGLVFGGVYGIEALSERHDEKVAAAMQAKLGVDTATQQALLSELQQAQAANAVRDAEQNKLIQSLVSQMAQQRAETAKQVATDSTLSAKDAADRLTVQTHASPGQATAVNDTVVMDLPLTREVVANMDSFAQAKADVTNLTGQLNAQEILTSDARLEVQDAQKVISADKDTLIATIKADAAACDVRVDNQAKKDLKRGFWGGVVSFLGGIVVRGFI